MTCSPRYEWIATMTRQAASGGRKRLRSIDAAPASEGDVLQASGQALTQVFTRSK